MVNLIYLRFKNVDKNSKLLNFETDRKMVYKSKYQIFNTDGPSVGPIATRILFTKIEVRSSLRSDAIVNTTNGRTNGQTDITQMSSNFALIKCFQAT